MAINSQGQVTTTGMMGNSNMNLQVPNMTNLTQPEKKVEEPTQPTDNTPREVGIVERLQNLTADDMIVLNPILSPSVKSGAFTPETKREAVRWCIKNLHRTWWGEAIRRGYRYYGQKAINEGKAKNHYQEFKNYVAFGTGRKRNLKTAWTFIYRTIQFFIKGVIIKK